MKESKKLYNKQIDKRIFDQDINFLQTTNLTPTLKTKIPLEHIKNISIKDSSLDCIPDKIQVKKTSSQLLKKIQFLENNFQWMLEHLKDTIKNHNKQYNKLLEKIQTVKKRDEQVETLIERQDQILLALHQKIRQLQQIIKQQEIKLINTQSALNEAHQHLEQIKKQ